MRTTNPMMDQFQDPESLAAAPEKLPPHRFCLRPKLDKEATRKEGRNIYADAPWIDVQIDSQSAISRHATPEDLKKYARSYQRFLEDQSSEGIVGTRLEEWAPMPRSIVEEFRHFKLRTVEDVANLSDARASEMSQGREWRDRAQHFLKSTKEAAPLEQVAAENRDLKARLEALERQLKQTNDELDKATAPKQRKLG